MIDINLIIASIFAFLFLIFALVFLGYVVFVFFKNRGRENSSIDSVLLQVAVPRMNEIKIDAMEQLFSSLYSMKKGGWQQKFSIQPTISFELVARQEDIKFFVWAPKSLKDLVEKQIHGAYPDAEVIETDEYNIFTESGKVAYKSLQLSKSNFYSLKTFKDLSTDPLSSLTSALGKMGTGEAAAIQILISPAENDWQKAGGKFVSETKKQERDPEKAKFSTPAKTLEAVEGKIAKPGFETSIRVVVVSESEDIAKSHLTNIVGAFAQFAGDLNSLKSRKVHRKGAFMEDFLYRYHSMFNFFGNHPSILNSEELATIYHFPNKTITTPHIFWLNAKTAPAPSQIPTEGLYLGVSSYRGIKRQVYIGEEDRMRHVYVIGKTGTGKSELLKDMVLQDIRSGKGLCFMDPHGDALQDIMRLIPPERAEDVIYFSPADTERPLGLNLLAANTKDQKHFETT